MIKKLAAAVLASTTLVGAGVAIGSGGSEPTIPTVTAPTATERALADQQCQEKSFDDPGEFAVDHGTGAAAMGRCITRKVSKAHFECRREAAEDRVDFAGDYGTDPAAHARCVQDELT